MPSLPAHQHDAAVGLRSALERVALEADPAWWRDHPTAAVIRAALQNAKVAGIEKAMGPRENPRHPMFRDHNCSYCASGEKPCRQGNPNRCEYPHARND